MQGEDKAQLDESFWQRRHLQREPLPASTHVQQDVEATLPVLVCPAEASSLIFSCINSCSAFGRDGTVSNAWPVSHQVV